MCAVNERLGCQSKKKKKKVIQEFDIETYLTRISCLQLKLNAIQFLLITREGPTWKKSFPCVCNKNLKKHTQVN